uniref:NADH-ubiquinone oxidoreductase chain 3 n=1 Tax=Cynoglossus nanhaiensis TaxID=2213132 RepID=A0A7L7S7Z8_9PLEU|nr:NADH dehydrogenase subunit 3 [Cynoglossus nanhaiensis]AWQ65114.1 NADH dehydrogenase subunit 3 [Cynoglossus nanhaiensis]QNV46920.1 NADH dehydrogenase subunit 3 [Cynoglossus nanhaiensis]
MNFIMIMICITITLSIILMLVAHLLPDVSPDFQKLSPYECGFDPMGSARLPFSLHFFLVAILFLLFDLEIALLFPLPWADQLPSLTIPYTYALVLIILLGGGLAYEWVQGGLEWAK